MGDLAYSKFFIYCPSINSLSLEACLPAGRERGIEFMDGNQLTMGNILNDN